MGMVKEDNFFDQLGNICSCLRIEKRTLQPKDFVNQNRDISEWDWRGIFLIIFYDPRFASGLDQNQLTNSDVSREKKHRVVTKIVEIFAEFLPNKKLTSEKLITHSKKFWTRISEMTDSNAESNWMIPKGKKVAKTDIFFSKRSRAWAKVMILKTSEAKN